MLNLASCVHCSVFSKAQFGFKELHRIGILVRFYLLLQLRLTTIFNEKECEQNAISGYIQFICFSLHLKGTFHSF